MTRSIIITINGQRYTHNSLIRKALTVKEIDSIGIQVIGDSTDDAPSVYFEDYLAPVSFVEEEGSLRFEVPEGRYFSECFGFALVRIEFDDGSEIVAFDVQARKTSADQARKMIEYLASQSENLIKSCFSRSSIAIGMTKGEFVDPETMLSTAECFIETLQSFQFELLNNIRERLVKVRTPLWHSNIFSYEIDPYDVLSNLDSLTPSASAGDVFIKGRHFDLDGIYVSSMQPTADVIENRVLLGGLYGVRRKIGQLLLDLESLDVDSSGNQGDYESFSRLMLSLTAGGMIKRCKVILDSTDRFIRLFQLELGVKYVGEAIPTITPYVRSTRIYRMLFTQLSLWYELGNPSIGAVTFLMKLKSLSKIYEMFVLFHLMDQLCSHGWLIKDATPHQSLGEYVPSKVVLENESEKITFQYEPIIEIWNKATSHMDLVDVGHHPSASHPYWKPDFVLKLEGNGATRYIILDAKYSTRTSVKNHHIPALFEKYYVATATYDAINGTVTHAPIVGVFAVFSLDDKSSGYISKWSRHGVGHALPRIPMVGGIGLMTENSDAFNELLVRAIEITRGTMIADSNGSERNSTILPTSRFGVDVESNIATV